ncbi:hypothetical protein CERZMDRAFT_96363 [Cercospora zeae-maydis SCOH1-5]|uniref:Uncharacterized protein n=1 Tax=Cercospora zeae-maydis SCOH1-5 TaxID=717836 RepID=A0A6A6FJF9_9PEZI|nr:hypothetical protein CERZMDRAFT_96363 [Cercospora zeae-maydis SCOH1-5]
MGLIKRQSNSLPATCQTVGHDYECVRHAPVIHLQPFLVRTTDHSSTFPRTHILRAYMQLRKTGIRAKRKIFHAKDILTNVLPPMVMPEEAGDKTQQAVTAALRGADNRLDRMDYAFMVTSWRDAETRNQT